jgi:polyhydroxybutyrate depolymerase
VFVGDLINLLREELDVDPNRVYATGFSNGAQMANRLMCEMADVFAAVAPVSGSFPPEETCRPSRPVPIVVFHGTADTTLPVPYDEIRDWLARWAERTNGCAPAPTVTYRNGAVTGETWGGCRDNAEIVLFTVQGGGHSWPGTSSETTYLDPPNHDIQASRAIWDFFAAHPLPQDASSPPP